MSCMDVVELEAVEALLHGLHAHRGSHFMDALVGHSERFSTRPLDGKLVGPFILCGCKT